MNPWNSLAKQPSKTVSFGFNERPYPKIKGKNGKVKRDNGRLLMSTFGPHMYVHTRAHVPICTYAYTYTTPMNTLTIYF